MSEIVMNEGRDAVLLVGGGSLCAAAVPLLQAAGLVPAGVIHGPRCDFAAEAGVPPLGRDADLARLRPDFSRAVVTAPHKQAAKLRRLLHDALRELGFTLVSAVHPDAHRRTMSIWGKARTWVRASSWRKGPIWAGRYAWMRACGWKKIFLCRTMST